MTRIRGVIQVRMDDPGPRICGGIALGSSLSRTQPPWLQRDSRNHDGIYFDAKYSMYSMGTMANDNLTTGF